MPTEDVPLFLHALATTESDIVFGSRFLAENGTEGIPLFRKIILRLGVLYTNILSGVRLTDTHNGFRIFTKKAYNAIVITRRDMEHASEIIEEVARKNICYSEVPVIIEYTDYSLGKGQKSSTFIKLGLKVLLRKLL
jgi:polyprenyl-phospho-N-acetylgalactosaminyl synthase